MAANMRWRDALHGIEAGAELVAVGAHLIADVALDLGREGADAEGDDAVDLAAARPLAGEARNREAGDHQVGGQRNQSHDNQRDREGAADGHSTLPVSEVEVPLEPNISPANVSSP